MGQVTKLEGEAGMLRIAHAKPDKEGEPYSVECDVVLPFFGLTMTRPGRRGLNLEEDHPVDTAAF